MQFTKSVFCVAILAAATVAIFVSSASAGTTTGCFGSNCYEFVLAGTPGTSSYGVTWESASAAALARGGHLATVSSAEENSFLLTLTSDYSGLWVGAWLGGMAKGPESGTWVEGPDAGSTMSYMYWSDHNNDGYIYMQIGTGSGWPIGSWLDASGDPSSADPVYGYFIEYEGAAAVPEPGLISLLGIGMAGVIGLAIRFRD